MCNSKSNKSKKELTENNKPQSGLLKTFPGFNQILRWQAEAKGITLEELEENMQRQSALTIRPHDEVMKEILEGVEWSEEEDLSSESQEGDCGEEENTENRD